LLEEAQSMIQAAVEKVREIGQPMSVAVVDSARDLKAFVRMEDAWLGSIDIAINKAFTSASFLMPTQDLAEMTQPGMPLYGLETTNAGRVVNVAGGIPFMRGGEVAGAIGVSGGTVDQDQEVAEAGVAGYWSLTREGSTFPSKEHFSKSAKRERSCRRWFDADEPFGKKLSRFLELITGENPAEPSPCPVLGCPSLALAGSSVRW
jgi:uncharacterized protein GlcG (DUF336 family)